MSAEYFSSMIRWNLSGVIAGFNSCALAISAVEITPSATVTRGRSYVFLPLCTLNANCNSDFRIAGMYLKLTGIETTPPIL